MAVRKYVKLYPYFVSRNLQAKMAYRADFWMGITANFLQQSLGLAFLWVIFQNVPAIEGWSFYQIAFLYGVVSIPSGLCELFLEGAWSIPGEYINMGNLDKVLTRPVAPLFYIVASAMELHGLGLILFGMTACGISLAHLGISLTLGHALILIITLISGAFIYFAINLIIATLAFWLLQVNTAMVMVHHLNEFARYPVTIYHKAVQILLTFIVPFAMMGHYPAAYLLGMTSSWWFALAAPAAAVVFMTAAVCFFTLGLRAYKSAGG